MKVVRRKGRIDAAHDERRFWLNFTTGKIVDPTRCPKGILAHGHWRLSDEKVAVGEPNTVCACVEPEPEPEAIADAG